MLEIKRLKIIAKTAGGDYGVDIPFKSGLFILRVENTHGKSTCMNAIAFALGMEKALGHADVKLPFPPSLTKEIADEFGIEHPVISSRVLLEIGDGLSRVATIKRQILGVAEDNIAEIYECPMNDIESHTPGKYFLHREGDTSRELGFFYWLCRFIGWNLPKVPTLDGREALLYPSVFFPTWFVEQKKGWTSIQATTPLFLKIKEAKKRALEFILSLETNDLVNRKFQIKTALDDLNQEWKLSRKKFELAAAKISGSISGVPETPESKFDPYKIDIAIKFNEKWRSIQFVKDEIEAKLDIFLTELKNSRPSAEKDLEIQKRIESNKEDLRHLFLKSSDLEEEISYFAYQIKSTSTRITSLTEDKRKYDDLIKISELEILRGSEASENTCPTCLQQFNGNLASMKVSTPLMSLDESLSYIKEQIKTFQSVRESLSRQNERKKIELVQTNSQIQHIHSEIARLQRETPIPESLVLEENLRRKINLENLIQDYKDGINTILQTRLELAKIVKKHNDLVEQRKKIPSSILSTSDTEKLEKLRASLINLLGIYGFSSFKPELIEISEENYLPTREGFDIGFDTSASDGIRIIWSYLISLFRIGMSYETNHPGVLIFDEPRQQEAKKVSFTELLKSVALLSDKRGQIILATSEDEDVLKASLEGKNYTLLSFPAEEGKILRPFKHS